jgi:bifunctional non-homologous end joining protein LigD
LGGEGIVSKMSDVLYRSECSDAWLKIEVVQGVLPARIHARGGIAALYLGKRKRKELKFMGKIRTGFTRAASADPRKKLDAFATPKSRFPGQGHVVDPKLIADDEFRDITSEATCSAAGSKD